MRNLTDHIVLADLPQSQIEISVLDEPGQGNACHQYRIGWIEQDGTKESCYIDFQNGPIKDFGINGITQEALLAILIDRLRGFQGGPFACRDNAVALTHLEDALMWLQKRTRERLIRGVEGTNQK